LEQYCNNKLDNTIEKGIYNIISKIFKKSDREDKSYTNLKYKFERFCLTFERSLLPQKSFKSLTQLIKNLSLIAFDGITQPTLAGSYKNDCYYDKGFIDFIAIHSFDKKIEPKLEEYIKVATNHFNSGDEVFVEINKLNPTDFVIVI
jgi:hypothetical protein